MEALPSLAMAIIGSKWPNLLQKVAPNLQLVALKFKPVAPNLQPDTDNCLPIACKMQAIWARYSAIFHETDFSEKLDIPGKARAGGGT